MAACLNGDLAAPGIFSMFTIFRGNQGSGQLISVGAFNTGESSYSFNP